MTQRRLLINRRVNKIALGPPTRQDKYLYYCSSVFGETVKRANCLIKFTERDITSCNQVIDCSRIRGLGSEKDNFKKAVGYHYPQSCFHVWLPATLANYLTNSFLTICIVLTERKRQRREFIKDGKWRMSIAPTPWETPRRLREGECFDGRDSSPGVAAVEGSRKSV